jgi:phenylalanyl-tRNA synthetase beta chain
LVGLNLIEVNSLHLINEDKNFKNMNLKPRNFVVLENALTTDYDALRSWLIPNFMKIFQENTNERYPQRIFEIGRTFELQKSDVNEEFKLGVAIASSNTNFTEIKSILEGIFKLIDKKVKTIPKDHASFIPGRSAAITYRGKEIGIIGEIHPDVILNWNLEVPITAFEINIESLL